MSRQLCPFHPDDDIAGTYVGPESGEVFTCPRPTGHPSPGRYVWPGPPPVPKRLPASPASLFTTLHLATTLPAAIEQAGGCGQWLEHGVVEHSYAIANPDDFQYLVSVFGHAAIRRTEYTVSAFIGGTLARLYREGMIEFHEGPATGRWTYNASVGWWSLPPAPDWDARRLSWTEAGLDVTYVLGQNER